MQIRLPQRHSLKQHYLLRQHLHSLQSAQLLQLRSKGVDSDRGPPS
jgi:hypothetical protein